MASERGILQHLLCRDDVATATRPPLHLGRVRAQHSISAGVLCSHSLPYIENLTRTPVVFVSFSKKDRVVRGIDSAIFPVLALRLPPSDARDRVRVQRAPRRASVLYALAGNQPSTGKCVYATRNGSGLKNGAAKRERTYTLYDMTSHNTTAAPPHFLRCYTKCRSWYGD